MADDDESSLTWLARLSSIPGHVSSGVQHESVRRDPEFTATKRAEQSKPKCFLVIGKPGVGRTLFSTQLAEATNSRLVSVKKVVTEAISSRTELGIMAEEILIMGKTVPQDLAVKLLEAKILSPEISSCGYVLDDFPCVNEEYLPIHEQLYFIDSWPLTPDVIVHLKISDIDLECRRVEQKVDPVTGYLYVKDIYAPQKQQKEVKKEDDKTCLAPEIIRRLVKRPEDLQPQVGKSLERFRSAFTSVIEEYLFDHPEKRIIELDANRPVNVLIQDTLVKLAGYREIPAHNDDADVMDTGDGFQGVAVKEIRSNQIVKRLREDDEDDDLRNKRSNLGEIPEMQEEVEEVKEDMPNRLKKRIHKIFVSELPTCTSHLIDMDRRFLAQSKKIAEKTVKQPQESSLCNLPSDAEVKDFEKLLDKLREDVKNIVKEKVGLLASEVTEKTKMRFIERRQNLINLWFKHSEKSKALFEEYTPFFLLFQQSYLDEIELHLSHPTFLEFDMRDEKHNVKHVYQSSNSLNDAFMLIKVICVELGRITEMVSYLKRWLSTKTSILGPETEENIRDEGYGLITDMEIIIENLLQNRREFLEKRAAIAMLALEQPASAERMKQLREHDSDTAGAFELVKRCMRLMSFAKKNNELLGPV